MAINRVEIKDFLVFQGEFAVDFCSGVNVIIGGNGTGKTTLMKVMYLITELENTRKKLSPDDKSKYSALKHYFHNICINSCYLSWGTNKSITNRQKTEIYVHCVLDDLNIVNDASTVGGLALTRPGNQIFIPAKDILEHSEGLLALNNTREIPFDQTYIDILSNAELGVTKEISETNKLILNKIKDIIGGEVEFENDTFYIVKSDGQKVPYSLEASGYRKFGLLWKLARNGLLEDGTILFLDEPENSLNPELMPELVNVLLELQRGGVQIFIATHSEILASYFAVNRKKDNEVNFFSLYKDGAQIKCNKSDRFDLLTPNTLTAEQVNLYEREIEKGLGNA
ncbi:ATP-binding protein [Spirochaetia bacterium]|nr:ATP-binding protein [Spirochaetia bacterium]